MPELHQEETDLLFEKTAVSAFSGNNLLAWLRQHRCHHLLLAGVSTPLAIESTARQAHDAGFQVTVLHDLCAAPRRRSPAEHGHPAKHGRNHPLAGTDERRPALSPAVWAGIMHKSVTAPTFSVIWVCYYPL